MKKPIMIIGEHLNEVSYRSGKAIDGPGTGPFFVSLRQAGIDPADCHFANVFNLMPPRGRFENFFGPKTLQNKLPPLTKGKYVKPEYLPEIEALWREIEDVQPNVIVTMGNMAMWAVTGKSGIKKHRGAPTHCINGKYKVIPTWTPLSVVRNWQLRVVMLSDLDKARRESTTPELRRPQRYIYLEPTLADITEFYEKHLRAEPFISCDIETKSLTITEVGFSDAAGKHALVIPFYSRMATDGNYWPTAAEEEQAWRWVRKILATCPTIGQNFSYDMQYLWRTMGIPSPMFAGDSMVLHHALQPELEKGLGFLGSIYTNEPSWKFMRQANDNLKRGDD